MAIKSVKINGFKSINQLESLKLNPINILIGANSAGKSNFISYFKMLNAILNKKFQTYIATCGGADRILFNGSRTTKQIDAFIENQDGNSYHFVLSATVDNKLVFSSETPTHFFESFYKVDNDAVDDPKDFPYHQYPKLKTKHITHDDISSNAEELITNCDNSDIEAKMVDVFSGYYEWKIYHFHDTSDFAGVKRLGSVHDNAHLRYDASNLAAFLYKIKLSHKDNYQKIINVVRLAIPYFDNFVLEPHTLPTQEQQINLLWMQKNSDYPFWPSQLSDGAVRFICLAAALLQPNPPSTIIIDEPELGLHPYAILLLAELIKVVSNTTQIILATQSVTLLNHFNVDDLIITENQNGISTFKRLNTTEYKEWLNDYSVGELWEKNIFGGRP